MAIPLHPAAVGGKVPHLIEAAGIPGLRDQIASRKNRIMGQRLE